MEALKPFRARIDALDDKIIDLLAERTDIVREVGHLNPGMVRKVYTAIIDEAHEIEQALASK